MNTPKSTFDELLAQDISGNNVLVRVDYNIPIGVDGSVSPSDSYRIECSVHTIRTLLDRGARVILATHFGRAGADIAALIPQIQTYFPVSYISDWGQVNTTSIQVLLDLHPGTVVLLPNTRSHSGEESNDLIFAELLGSLASLFVHEAFSVAHRDHASVSAIQSVLPSYAGYWHGQEIAELSRAKHPQLPAVVIIGGAKFDTKLTLIQHYLDIGAFVAVVGALAHAIYRARGLSIGQSLCDDTVNVESIAHHEYLWVPDMVVAQDIHSGNTRTVYVTELSDSERIVDADVVSAQELASNVIAAQSVIWNGPLGLYESGFVAGTEVIKNALLQSTAFRVIGGGDTLAMITPDERKNIATFCSTGGGAMLEFLVE